MTLQAVPITPDAQLEHEIEREYRAMLDDWRRGNRQQARYHMDKMYELIGQRSTGAKDSLAQAKGLPG